MSFMRVLLVDDDPSFSEFVGAGLARSGFDVVHVPAGIAALAALDTGNFSLVLLDLALPDMDGLEVLRRLKTRVEAAPPIILVSGRGTVRSALAAGRLGAVDFVEKPLILEDLIDCIRSAAVRPLQHSGVLDGSTVQDLVGWVTRVIVSPVDVRTVTAWAKLVGVSETVLFSRCARCALKPKRILDLGRLLRVAHQGAGARNHDFEALLDVRDVRTVHALLSRSGLTPADLNMASWTGVLAKQELVLQSEFTDALAASLARRPVPPRR